MRGLGALILLTVMVFCFAKKRPTTTCLQPETHCGDNLCCCNGNIKQAKCSLLGDKLTYIPKLPENTTVLFISHNNITVLSRELLVNVSSLPLLQLDLVDNNIQTLAPDTFGDFKTIKHLKLDLSKNLRINKTELSIALGSIPKSIHLHLYMQSIGLSQIPLDYFLPMNGSRIREIYLDGNLLKAVNVASFQYMLYLKKLQLEKNLIQNFDASFGHQRLVSIGLAGNEIARHAPQFCSKETINPYPYLLKLDLRKNFISDLKPTNWNCLKPLQTLILTANVIRKVSNNTFSRLPDLRELYLNEMLNSNMKLETLALNSSSLKKLKLDRNNMVFKSDDIKRSYFKNCPNVTELDISNNRFIDIDYSNITYFLSFLHKLEYLSMVRCRLHTVPPGLFYSLPNINHLNLDGNGISSLDGAFIGAKNISTFSVDGNNIKLIGPDTFPDNVLRTIRTIVLADNPFECTCKLLWFRSAIGHNGILPGTNVTLSSWPRRYKCSSPRELHGKWLINYRPTEESCRESNLIYIIVSALSTLLFLTIVITPVAYRYRWYISYWLYKRKHHEVDPERQPLLQDHAPYTYVIYNDEDHEYVHGAFRNLIEGQFGFKLFIWHRDAELGGSKANVMFDAIHRSKHVIAVVSKYFMADSWCEFQLDVAKGRQIEIQKDFLTLVILEDVHKAIVKKSWCVKLTRLETVYWCADEQDIRRKVFDQQINKSLKASTRGRTLDE